MKVPAWSEKLVYCRVASKSLNADWKEMNDQYFLLNFLDGRPMFTLPWQQPLKRGTDVLLSPGNQICEVDFVAQNAKVGMETIGIKGLAMRSAFRELKPLLFALEKEKKGLSCLQGANPSGINVCPQGNSDHRMDVLRRIYVAPMEWRHRQNRARRIMSSCPNWACDGGLSR